MSKAVSYTHLVNLIEVNVQDSIFYRMELNIFQDSVYFFAIDVQVYDVDAVSYTHLYS